MIERLLAAEDALDRQDLEPAERLFAQVVEADPLNAMALVGLARVAARRGDLGSARAAAARALAIDPDEAAARRLLAELDTPEPVPQVKPHVARRGEPHAGGPAGEQTEPRPGPGREGNRPTSPSRRAPVKRGSPLDRLRRWLRGSGRRR